MTAVETTRPSEPALLMRVGGELLGSFLICLALYLMSTIGLTLYGPYMSFVALATGLVYCAVTMMLSGFCTCQFNPAITVAAMLTSKTRVLDGVLAIVAQIVGALAAGALTVKVLLPTSSAVTMTQWMSYVNNGFDDGSFSNAQLSQAGVSFGITAAIAVEVIAGLVIVGVAMRMIDNQGGLRPGYAAAMGVAYGACAAFATPITGAALNPARATGIAVFAASEGLTWNPLGQLWVFWICPVLAAALVALPMIAAQMMKNAKSNPAPANDAEAEEVVDAESVDQTVDESTDAIAQADEVPASADEHADTEVGDQQSDSESDTDHSVERD